MRKVFYLIFLCAISTVANGQLVYNTGVTAQALVNNLLGPGVVATNITYTGAANSKATFTCSGACSLGFPAGVMLSTGQAGGQGVPASFFASTDNGTAGDAQLNAIVSPQQTQDAAVLEFDFTIPSDSVKFEYIFGSEEYNDYVNTPFNDVFAFYISGPGITGVQNMAIVPGTANTAVSINNVNNGGPYGGVASGPCTNCAYYVDNVGGANFFLDGHTTVLTAKAAVQPCQTYHMKIAIADVSDGVFDSDVFLKAGSFSAIGPVTVYANGVPIGNGGNYYACPGSTVNLCLSPAANYNWSTGDITQCISIDQTNINATGTYEAIFVGPNCFGFSQVNIIYINPTATITPSGPVDLCPGGNVTLTANPGNTWLWSNGATTQSINVSNPGTYTVTVTFGSGVTCSAVSSPVTVTVGAATAQINGVLSLCNGSNTTLTASAGQSYLWNTGATSQSINVSTAGNYTVTVTQTGGCTASATAAVSINANPVPAITGTLSFCQGSNTIIDAGPGFSSYLWSNGSTAQTLNVTAGGTYTVTVTNASGCSGSTSAAVVENALPVPSISGTLAFCSGGNTTLNAGAGYSSYLWSNGDVTQTTNITAGGSYSVTVTNANNCSATTSAAVTVNPLPTPNITGTFSICQGNTTTIDAGAGYSNYLWSNGSSAQSITVGTGLTFTVTVTDANGCTNSDAQLITVNANPVPSISGTFTICQGNNTILTATPGFANYLWSTGAGTPNLNVSTAGNFGVTVTDANGCTGTTSQVVTVNPLPSPSITGNLSFCSGNNSNLNAGPGFASYLWNNGATTQILNVTTSGTYSVTVTSAAGCSASTSASVVVNSLPAPAITGTTSFCQGSNTTLNATPGFASYQWSNGSVNPSITVAIANTFSVTVTDANGCTGSTSQTTIVNPNPVPSITGTNAICQGTSTGWNAGAGYSSYSWSTGASTASVNLNTAGTYSVTVTDANGCTGTTSQTLTVNPIPSTNITGNTTFCQGQNSNLNAGAGFASYLWNTGATSQVLNVTTSGNYIVTVTNGFGCSLTTNTLVTVNSLPNPAITGPSSICIGNSATLNAGNFASYLWSNGATSQTISTTNAGNYTVTVTNAAGCTASTSASLVVNPLPTPTISGVTTVCQGVLTTLDAGSGYTSYLWSNGATGQTINTGSAGNITVTVTDANGCSAPASTSVTVNPLPAPTITGVNEFCDGSSGVLDAGAGFSSYLWNTGATSRSISVTTAGMYTVTVTAATGCTGNDNELVTVQSNPVPVISGPTAFCQGSSTTLDAGGGYATYQWSNGATTQTVPVSTATTLTVTVSSAFGCTGTTSASTSINPLPTPSISGITDICQGTTTSFDAGAGYTSFLWSNGSTTQVINPGTAGTYTVTVTDANGCQNNTSIALNVNQLPVPVISGNFEFCQGDNSNINANGGFVDYLWNTGATTPMINVTNAGSYAVTVTDNNGCSASTATTIIVNALPTPTISGLNAICDGTTTTFNAGNYVSFVWSDGSTAQTLTTGIAGTYDVTVTDVNGCVGSTSQSLTVYDLPSAVLTGTNTICYGESSPIGVVLNGTAPFTFTYSINGVPFGTPVNANGNNATINVAPGITTDYSLVTISDAHCSGSVAGNATITVNPLPQPVVTGDLSICDGSTTSLYATPGFNSYTWSNGSSQTSISTGVGGIYTVTVIDANGCEGTSPAVNLIVNMVPSVSFTNDTSLTCEVPNVNFINQSIYDAGSTFEWNFGDGGISNEANPSHLYFATGTYPVSLVIVTPAGCTSNTTNNVNVFFYPLPVADFVTSEKATNVFNGKINFVDRSSYAVAWLWDFGDGQVSQEQNPSHYFNQVGDYKVSLRITSITGCEDYHEEVININPFYIPNAFTPNGDGVNDVFYYSGYNLDVKSYNMNVFNRWGQLVFSGAGENDNWNGETLKGETAPQGTYLYKLVVTTRGGEEHVFNGQVNLIR